MDAQFDAFNLAKNTDCCMSISTRRIVFFRCAVSLICFLLFQQSLHSQVVTWVGGTNNNYFTASNWSPSTNTAALAQTETLLIGAGNPNEMVHNGGNAANSYRANFLNTTSNANITVNGILYSWNSDSLNGRVTLNTGADFSCRNIGYIGRNGSCTMTINGGRYSTRNGLNIGFGNTGSNATIHLFGGSITSGTTMSIANGTGLSARINISGGALIVGSTLTIGTNAIITITGIGYLQIAGDKRTQVNGLMSDGRITTSPGKTLAVVYNGTNTVVSIPQNPNSLITEYPDTVVLRTNQLVCVLEKSTGNVLSYRFKGVETVANKSTDAKKYMYHDFTTSYGFETIWGCTYEVVEDSDTLAHIVFKRPYTPSIGHVTPCDAELHYALKKNDMGVYVYSKLEHKPNYPKFDMGSWRQVWWIAANNGINVAERIYTDSLRSWEMPSGTDYANADASGIAEIVKLTSGVRAGKFDGKYQYSLRFWDHPVWGHASNINNIGLWCVNPNLEYYNEGPMHQDLNAAAGIIHQCMNGVHYGDGGMIADTLTSWTKVYGPYLLLLTDKPTGNENWAAAKERQQVEKQLWPYKWVKDTIAYPPASLRGSITGKFVVVDSKKPSFTGAFAWVGVTDLSDGASNFQFESKHYHYWIKSDANGNFTIPNVRAGTYSLFAFVDGMVGEYRLNNVTVSEGNLTNLGTLTKTVDRSYGDIIWEIGIANRRSNEYKLGNFDYCEGFVERKFRDSFPNPIEYATASNNWSTVLNYAHTKYPTTTFAPGDLWKWRLNFTLPTGFNTSGNARLTIAYSSNDHAQQWIYVNNENSLFTSYYPDNGDGNAFIRQANYAKYAYKEVFIPMNRFVAGNNTITLAMPSNSLWVSHLMYDYISLEANVPTTLAVTFTQFSATKKENTAVLQWSTTSERNSNYFIVQKSEDGTNFRDLGMVKSNNNANSINNYSFTDYTLTTGKQYYRIVEVDKSNQKTYSNVQQLQVNSAKAISIFPNPAQNSVVIEQLTTPIQSIEIIDAVGKVFIKKLNIRSNKVVINIESLSKGAYFLRINDGKSTSIHPLQKQ